MTNELAYYTEQLKRILGLAMELLKEMQEIVNDGPQSFDRDQMNLSLQGYVRTQKYDGHHWEIWRHPTTQHTMIREEPDQRFRQFPYPMTDAYLGDLRSFQEKGR